MNRSVGHGCRFGLVTYADGDVRFECPAYDQDTRCPVEGCPAHADVRYCPIDGRRRYGMTIGSNAVLVCDGNHKHIMPKTEWVERLAEVKVI